jgi:hypothetical protein
MEQTWEFFTLARMSLAFSPLALSFPTQQGFSVERDNEPTDVSINPPDHSEAYTV